MPVVQARTPVQEGQGRQAMKDGETKQLDLYDGRVWLIVLLGLLIFWRLGAMEGELRKANEPGAESQEGQAAHAQVRVGFAASRAAPEPRACITLARDIHAYSIAYRAWEAEATFDRLDAAREAWRLIEGNPFWEQVRPLADDMDAHDALWIDCYDATLEALS